MLTKKLSCQSSQAGSGTLEDHNISHPVQVLDAKKSNYNLQRMRQAGGELFGWATTLSPCLSVGWVGVSFGWWWAEFRVVQVFRPVGNGRYRSKCLLIIFHIDSLTDTNRVVWVTNLLEDILLGVGHKLNWIYGPRQICQIDFSRHLRRKYLSDAQERGLNFLQPSELLLLYLVFSANLAWRLTPPMAGAQKLAPLMGFWDLRDGAPSSVLSHWKWICSSVKAQIDFCSCCLHKELNL